MQIRPATLADLDPIREIDGTVESSRYFHLDESAGEGFNLSWRIEERPTREKLIDPNRLTDDADFTLKQIGSGADEGAVWVVEIDEQPVAAIVAKPDVEAGTMLITDLRVDYDFRRQGL